MQTFEDLNDQIVYTKVKSRNAAINLKDDAKETAASGKTVVIFFEDRYHLYLAPGQDPYQIRREIDAWRMNPTVADTGSDATPATTTTTTKTKSSKPKLKR